LKKIINPQTLLRSKREIKIHKSHSIKIQNQAQNRKNDLEIQLQTGITSDSILQPLIQVQNWLILTK